MNWRGTPLVSLATIVSLIASTRTRCGLRADAHDRWTELLEADEFWPRIIADEQFWTTFEKMEPDERAAAFMTRIRTDGPAGRQTLAPKG